jgi:signal transduction histidine kinase
MPRRSHSQSSGHTILVVDDQEETLSSVRALLEREGHTVLTAEGGERALELFKVNDIHLILVDYFMPRMTGEDVVREIRKFDPFVQIVLATGYSGTTPPRTMLAELDIQGYHDKAEGPEQLLLWVDVGLKAYRRIRSLCERDRLQGELIANVSHEFRNPLCVITGYADLLLGAGFGALPEESKKPLQAIERAATSLDYLVSDFLSYAKLEAKALKVMRQTVSITELVQELEGLAGNLQDGRPLQFQVERRSGVETLHSDPGKLRAILRNLVSNAMKFTLAGTVTVRIEDSSEGVQFRVIDTGPGIAAEEQETIFEAFRQLDGSITRRHGGVGLGLALSHKLALLLDGALEVESELGHGASFTLSIPRATPAGPPPADAVNRLAGAPVAEFATVDEAA